MPSPTDPRIQWMNIFFKPWCSQDWTKLPFTCHFNAWGQYIATTTVHGLIWVSKISAHTHFTPWIWWEDSNVGDHMHEWNIAYLPWVPQILREEWQNKRGLCCWCGPINNKMDSFSRDAEVTAIRINWSMFKHPEALILISTHNDSRCLLVTWTTICEGKEVRLCHLGLKLEFCDTF